MVAFFVYSGRHHLIHAWLNRGCCQRFQHRDNEVQRCTGGVSMIDIPLCATHSLCSSVLKIIFLKPQPAFLL